MQNLISVQLFQFTPTPRLLAQPLADIKSTLLEPLQGDSSFFENSSEQSEMATQCRQIIEQANSVADFLSLSQSLYHTATAQRSLIRWLSFVFNQVFEYLMAQKGTAMPTWNSDYRAFELSDSQILAESDSNQIIQRRFGYLKFSHFKRLENGENLPVFLLQVRNRLAFTTPICADELTLVLQNKTLYLPVFDTVKKSAVVLRKLQWKPIFHFLPTKKDRRKTTEKAVRYAELFVKHGRITQTEVNTLGEHQNIGIAEISFYQNKNARYSYPAKDLQIVASDSLLTLRNDFGNATLPSAIIDMINLYDKAKKDVVSDMGNKASLLEQAKHALAEYFVVIPPLTCRQQLVKTPRFKLRTDKKTKEGVANEVYYYEDMLPTSAYGQLVIAYPNSELPKAETKKNFLSFFTGQTCKARKANLTFEIFDYSAKLAGREPNEVVALLLEKYPNCTGVLLAWNNPHQLINNKLIEFELIRRNIAVQHVIVEGKRLDAFKVSALIKGMQEKFPIVPIAKLREPLDLSPFDICIGLDISRHAGEDIASLPVALDRYGVSHCYLSDSYMSETKEKRSVTEIVQQIQTVVADYQQNTLSSQTTKPNVLFLRDGVAYEDYNEIARQLANIVDLTVVSVRKNLVAVASDELIEGEFSTIDGVLTEDSFVVGVNARQGEDYKVSQVHLAQVIVKPENISLLQIQDAFLTLIACNRTTESQMASLPMPIAYADRLAWDVRDFIQDTQLQAYVSKQYHDECNQQGGQKRFIYHTIRQYIQNRANGGAFAV